MRIEIDGLSHAYAGHAALRGVDLTIGAGGFVALVGASGSGKSTLLKSINRLIAPDAGTIRLDGRDTRDLPLPALRRSIGYVFQNVGLFPHMTVAENIAIGPRLTGGTTDVAALLDLVGLPAGHAGRAPDALSGGERQRVGVARALAGGARLVLLDEPFGALDPVTRDQLGRAYRALHDRLGLTSVIVTHDMAEALLLADRVLVMADGRIAGDATPAAMMRGEAGPAAAALVAVPADQARRLAALAS